MDCSVSSGTGFGLLVRLQPVVDLPAQHDQGHRAVAQRLVVKLLDIERIAEHGFGLAPQANEFQLPGTVGRHLARPDDDPVHVSGCRFRSPVSLFAQRVLD